MGLNSGAVSGLFLSYARSENCLSLIKSFLSQGGGDVFLYLDGPRDSRVEKSQASLIKKLEIMKSKGIKSIHIYRSTINQGIAVSMISALDWFFEKNDKGVVLEDDLVIGDSFVPFMQLMLDRYESDYDVLTVSGNRYTTEITEKEEIAWCNYPQTWGWGLWKRSWEEFRGLYDSPIERLKITPLSARKSFWATGTLYVKVREVDTWDIPIADFMYTKKAFTILPPANLVSNIGDDDYASHTTSNTFPMRFPISEVDLDALSHTISKSERILSSRRENTFLEKKIFKIKFRHRFLFIKVIAYLRKQNILAKQLSASQLLHG